MPRLKFDIWSEQVRADDDGVQNKKEFLEVVGGDCSVAKIVGLCMYLSEKSTYCVKSGIVLIYIFPIELLII